MVFVLIECLSTVLEISEPKEIALIVPTKISIPMPNRFSNIRNAYLTQYLRPLVGTRDGDRQGEETR